MRIKNTRRFGIVAGTVAAVLVGGGVAVAYWTTAGSGTGTAGVGNSQNVVVAQTSTIANLYPGGPASSVAYSINNPNAGPVYVGQVTVAVGSVTKAAGAPAGTCDATDFTIVQPAAINANVPVGTSTGSTGGTVAMVNKPTTNQDACKLATVNLTYTVS